MFQSAPPRLSDRFVDDAVRRWNRSGHGPGHITVIGAGTLEEGILVALGKADIGVDAVDDELLAIAHVTRDRPQVAVVHVGASFNDIAGLVRTLRGFLGVPVLLALDEDGVSATAEAAIMAGALPVLSAPLRAPSLLRELAPHWNPNPASRPIQFGVVHLDRDRMAARAGSRALELTVTEFEILARLADSGGAVVRREALRRLWPLTRDSDATLVAAITRLRRKLIDSGAGDIITTVRGVGYRLEPGTAA